tara:strand:- start:1415 stop:2122 length:708 start_codon:yes stop_codon:yes gene_type:complete
MVDLNKTMDAVAELHRSHGVKQKGGKLYTQVVHRMEAFRKIHGTDFGIDTKILVDDGKRVVVKAVITDKDGRIIGSGMAEEIRGQGLVNTTSALENGETSSIGRALASLGLSGGEYASANEMDAVVRKKQFINETPQVEVKEQEQASTSSVPPAPVPDKNEEETHNDVYERVMFKLGNVLQKRYNAEREKRQEADINTIITENIEDIKNLPEEQRKAILNKSQDIQNQINLVRRK